VSGFIVAENEQLKKRKRWKAW